MTHETFKIGTGAVYMHELVDEFKQKIQADCLYLDPPSCYRQLKAVYTRANQPMPEQYDTYETSQVITISSNRGIVGRPERYIREWLIL